MRRCFSRLAWLAWVVMPACLGEVTSEAPLELEADYFTGVTCTTPAVLSFEPLEPGQVVWIDGVKHVIAGAFVHPWVLEPGQCEDQFCRELEGGMRCQRVPSPCEGLESFCAVYTAQPCP